MRSQRVMNLATGVILQAGKYTVEEVLGQGAIGITYRATHQYWGKSVVLKTLNSRLWDHPDFGRFQRQWIAEAHRLAQCQHPNLVRMLDFFEEDGLCFWVMEYVPGQTLAELVNSGQPLSLEKALHYIRQIAEALTLVHRHGLLHRDIKPANIRVRADSDITMLTDFGIARDFTPGIRQTHANLISAGYVSREHYFPHEILTPACDVYALAATLYDLLVGQPPTPASLRMSPNTPIDLRSPGLELRRCQPDLPEEIYQSILSGLALEAHSRPQTVEDWLSLWGEYRYLNRHLPSVTPQTPVESVAMAGYRRWVPVLFLLTSMISGCLGFDFARKYAATPMAQNFFPSASRTTTVDFKTISNTDFLRQLAPSEPLFQELESPASSSSSLKLNKLPKDQQEFETDPAEGVEEEITRDIQPDIDVSSDQEFPFNQNLQPAPNDFEYPQVPELRPYDDPLPSVEVDPYYPESPYPYSSVDTYPELETPYPSDDGVPGIPSSTDYPIEAEPNIPVPPLPSLESNSPSLPSSNYTEPNVTNPPFDPQPSGNYDSTFPSENRYDS